MSVKPVLQNLKIKAVEKARAFLLHKIYLLGRPQSPLSVSYTLGSFHIKQDFFHMKFSRWLIRRARFLCTQILNKPFAIHLIS